MFHLPVNSRVCYGGPVDADVMFIAKLEELLPSELRAVVRNDGVWDSEAMDDVKEEQHGLLGFDCGNRLSFHPLCKLVYGDKQVGVALGCLFEWSNQIESPDCERPGNRDRLEHLGG